MVKDPEIIKEGDKPIFFWQATEFESHQKNKGWILFVILAGLAVAGVFVWMKLWMATAVSVAAVFALLSQARTSGKKKNYAIYDVGITIDEKIFSFDQFKSFWIFPYQERTIVRLEQTKTFGIPVEMPIEEENAEQIRLFLGKHLPEQEEKGEDISDKINRWIKF